MKKKIIKLVFVIMICFLICLTAVPSVFALGANYVPNENYTYWLSISGKEKKAVYSRPMYEVQRVIDAKSLGTTEFSEVRDICTDDRGYTYILDKESRIVIFDNDYNLVKEITQITENEPLTFVGAQSIYVHKDFSIFISDTENKRVLHCNENGEYINQYLLPDSPLIPDSFNYRPIRAVADSKGYVYVLSEGSYYGMLLYAPDMSFIAFYGANDVVNSVLGGIKSLLNRMFPNNTKKGNAARVLPDTLTDIVIDSNDFIYTATDNNKKAQIKKLNPGAGNNILNSDDVNFIDAKVNRTYKQGEAFSQLITGLDVNDNGFIFALDSSYGRVFLYDSECRLITAFGGGMGNGTQDGTFVAANAITVKGNDVLVSDKINNNITVFSCNDFGDSVLSLTKMTIDGDYTESKLGWENVLKNDRNLQIAYTGLARAYVSEGDYTKALDVALQGYDRETYVLAYEYHRNEWLQENFIWLFALCVTFIVVLIAFCTFIVKKKIKLIKNYEVNLMFTTLFHPGNAFETIKDKGKGSLLLSLIVVLMLYVVTVCQTMFGGFLFTDYDPGTFNSLWVFVQTVGLVVLWVVSNWLVCTLLSGKGKIKEIIIVTGYSLMPIILGKFIWTVASNYMLTSEVSFLNILNAVSLLWALLIFVIGMLRIHEFTVTKFIGTSILTVLCMAAIVFLLILIGILLQQLYGFITTLFIEILI